ncbi:hypothetical protein KGP40_04380 [Weissella cibaria]|nr:hypothetical protein [Weissella cibaria]
MNCLISLYASARPAQYLLAPASVAFRAEELANLIWLSILANVWLIL